MAEVRQDRGVVRDRPDAVRGEAVRRGLEDRRRVAAATIARRACLEVRRAGRRQVLGVRLAEAADLRLDRPDEPGRQPGRLERRHGEERGRRLAVGAGDADDAELARRVAVPPRGGVGEGAAATRRTTSCGSGRRAPGARRSRRRARGGARAKSWPSTCSPGTATKSAPGRTARESSVTPGSRWRAPPARSPASRRARRRRRRRRQALDQARRAAGLAGSAAAIRSAIEAVGHPSPAASAGVRDRPGRGSARAGPTRPARSGWPGSPSRAPGQLTHSAPNERLCW